MQHPQEITLHQRRTPEASVSKWITLCLSPSPQIPPKPVVPPLAPLPRRPERRLDALRGYPTRPDADDMGQWERPD